MHDLLEQDYSIELHGSEPVSHGEYRHSTGSIYANGSEYSVMAAERDESVIIQLRSGGRWVGRRRVETENTLENEVLPSNGSELRELLDRAAGE